MAGGDEELEDLDAAWGAALNEQKGDSGEDDDLAADWGAALAEQGVEGSEDLAASLAGFDDSEFDLDQATRGGDRILNQEEIDNLLGFDLDEQLSSEQSGIRALINSPLNDHAKRTRTRAIKIFADGTFGSCSACMSEPYADKTCTHGYMTLPDDEIKAIFATDLDLNAQGLAYWKAQEEKQAVH